MLCITVVNPYKIKYEFSSPMISQNLKKFRYLLLLSPNGLSIYRMLESWFKMIIQPKGFGVDVKPNMWLHWLPSTKIFIKVFVTVTNQLPSGRTKKRIKMHIGHTNNGAFQCTLSKECQWRQQQQLSSMPEPCIQGGIMLIFAQLGIMVGPLYKCGFHLGYRSQHNTCPLVTPTLAL